MLVLSSSNEKPCGKSSVGFPSPLRLSQSFVFPTLPHLQPSKQSDDVDIAPLPLAPDCPGPQLQGPERTGQTTAVEAAWRPDHLDKQ